MKTEYRIGNLIWNVLLGESKVLELRNDGVSICNPKNERNAYFIPNDKLHQNEPIPLTEEWLLRFGFCGKDHFTDLNLETTNLKFYCGNGRLTIVELELGYHVSINVKHVHQLQNLYFALIGEELTLQT
jgi:hypothetical protein